MRIELSTPIYFSHFSLLITLTSENIYFLYSFEIYLHYIYIFDGIPILIILFINVSYDAIVKKRY